jgi:uncharacterized protein YndB with AHSA1/START domain
MKPEIDVKAVVADSPADLHAWSAHQKSRLEPLPRGNKVTRAGAKPHVAIRVTQRYGASPTHAFNAWLDPEVAGRWLFATASQPMAQVEIDGRVGGPFCFVERQAGETAKYTGQYVEIVPDHRLVFTLSMPPHPNIITRVTVAIAPLAKGCALEVTHENIPRACAGYVEGRWTGILYGLGVTLDSYCTTFHRDQE